MSWLQPNPANQPQSGGTAVVVVSGSPGLTVAIAGSLSPTATLADVVSSVAADNASTGTDALATQTFNYGYNRTRDEWARIDALNVNSGNTANIPTPISGVAMYTASVITHPRSQELAQVWAGDDDDMKQNDSLLQTAARLYGFNRQSGGSSGSFWPRIDALMQRGTDNFATWFPTDSGIGLRTFTQLMGIDGNIPQVFSLDRDDLATDKGLFVGSFNFGWTSVSGAGSSSGQWVRFRMTESGKGVSGIPHRLVVAFSGDPVSISGQPVTVSISGIAINVSGNAVRTSGQTAMIGVPNFGTPIEGFGNFDDAMTNGIDSLATAAFNIGYDNVVGDWKRLRVTSSGAAMSGIAHKLAVDFSGATARIGADGLFANLFTADTDSVSKNNDVLSVGAFTLGYNGLTDEWNRIASVNSNSGASNAISGRHAFATAVFGTTPGNPNLATVSVDDNHADHNMLIVSDYPASDTLDIGRTTITNLSGGTALPTNTVKGTVWLQNESGNDTMSVGGNNAGDFPASNTGFQLFGGQSMTIKVQNTDQIAVWANTSGQRIRFLAED